MIKTGGRQDIIVQWFSREFMEQHRELFTDIILQPGEALFTIKDGKIGDVVTESVAKDVLPSFLGKLKEKVAGKQDIQLMVVDLKARMIQIPVSGFTKDRTEIKGIANMMVKVARENVYRVINMFPRGLRSDSKWDDNTQIKEVCDEDLSGFFEYDTRVTLDSYVFTKWEASDIREKMDAFAGDITQCINGMMPHWSRMGIDVTVNSVDIQENSYEDVMKFKNAMSQKQMIEDIKYTSMQNNLGNVASLEKERARLQKTVEMEKLASRIELEDTEFKAKLNRDLMETANSVQKIEMELKGEMAKATNAVEIRKLNGLTDLELKRAEEDLNLYFSKEKNEIAQMNADRDIDRVLKLKNNDLKLMFDERVAKLKEECARQVSEAELSVERASMEGFKRGKEEADKLAYEKGKADGYNEAIQKQIVNMNDFVKMQHQTPGWPQAPMYPAGSYPPMGYQQPPAYQQPREGGKFCPHCGNQLSAEAKFCHGCGKQQ